MPKCKKPLKKEVCQGCLTSGRKLLPIKEYLRLFKKLMEDVLGEEIKLIKIPSMCCQCRSILRSVQKFQERAKEAYKSFTKIDSDDKTIHDPHLSTLTDSTNPDYGMSDDGIKVTLESKSETGIARTVNTQEEVKTEFEYAVEGIKEESEFEVKIENEYPDGDSITEEADFAEHNDEITIKEEINESDKKINKEIRNKIKQQRRKLSKEAKYKIIRNIDYQDFTSLCSAVKIDDDERQKSLEFARFSGEYLKSNFRCDKCIVGFNKRQRLDKHLKIYHSEENPYECELCRARFSTKLILQKHVNAHSFKYVCSLCHYQRLYKKLVLNHVTREHRMAYECRECGLRFHDKYKEFYKHYNSMHRWFVCDYCGFRTRTKQRLINHIRVNHCENICKYCNKKYAMYHSMTRHIALRHTKEVSEESYCVECNMQFDNITLYTRHLKTSVKHKPKKFFPCTECPNVYAKKTAMNNHYKYIHLKKTNHYCDKCSRYFLNGFRLRQHIATYHNNIRAPKNKICSYCGRGFMTNRILDNHIRTHTGERPFACTHCTATFAQKSALVTHVRAIHKVMMRYSSKE